MQASVDNFIHLSEVIQSLSLAKTHEEVFSLVSKAAQSLVGAQGAAFILRDKNDQCYYTDEVSIAPLWKGQRFPMNYCISGWAMTHKQAVAIADVYNDPRIPIDAYIPTFIKSLAMIPIRIQNPMGAIGTYWATQHEASEEELRLLSALANSTATALENIQLLSDLKEANVDLVNSLRAKDEFLSLASHELRTPITAIKLQLESVKSYLSMNKEKITPDVLSQNIDSQLQRISDFSALVEELLDVSQIRLDRLEITPTQFDISETIQNVIHKYQPQIDKAECTLQTNIEENIIGSWDKERIVQMVTHLLSNIVKHAPKTKISVSVKRLRDKVSIAVQDSGPGIPKDIQGKMFERFERAASHMNVSGLGLGLYITRKLVDAHRGNLFLVSNENEGTKIVIDLPLVNKQPDTFAL